MFMAIAVFEKLIQFLSPKAQISEVENMINLSNKSNLPG